MLVPARVGKGRVADIDVAAAERMPGVLKVLCYKNAPTPLRPVPPAEPNGSSQTPAADLMFSDRVAFFGQYLALVVAERLEQAQLAAATLKVTYADVEKPRTDLVAGLDTAAPPKSGKAKDQPADTHRGDPAAAFAAAAVKVANVYSTPHETHNPMEMHATTASWDADGKLTLYDATQGISDAKAAVGTALELKPDQVRVIDPFVGGGFGSKGSTWPHTALAAVAAKAVGRPVRLMLTRPQMFSGVGYRTPDPPGGRAGRRPRRQAGVVHPRLGLQSPDYTTFLETAAEPTRHLYDCENAASSHKIVRVDTHAPCQMRAPGEATGLFAFEVAMDELAVALDMDPVALRMKNYAATDPQAKMPFSSKSLDKCYRQAAEKFGWAKRNPEPRSMTDGNFLVGYGMASAMYAANRKPSAAKVIAYADGSVVVRAGTQDIGTGTYTIMAQVAAAELGLPAAAVRAQLGDTNLPKSGVSGGSTTAASVGTAVQLAAARLRDHLIALAVADTDGPLHGLPPASIRLDGGKLSADGGKAQTDPRRRRPHRQQLGRDVGQPRRLRGRHQGRREVLQARLRRRLRRGPRRPAAGHGQGAPPGRRLRRRPRAQRQDDPQPTARRPGLRPRHGPAGGDLHRPPRRQDRQRQPGRIPGPGERRRAERGGHPGGGGRPAREPDRRQGRRRDRHRRGPRRHRQRRLPRHRPAGAGPADHAGQAAVTAVR